jgi:hypothetical protein
MVLVDFFKTSHCGKVDFEFKLETIYINIITKFILEIKRANDSLSNDSILYKKVMTKD